MNDRKIINLSGWLIFGISLAVYASTLEPTVSLWDCGEFLTAAYKLEINHSPGAPLFMLLGRLFSLLSLGNPARAAFAINLASAVASGGTILFLFWTLIWLIQKMEQVQEKQIPFFLKIGAAAVGALSFAFTDSFWFSAVEAEVYALSSLFSAAVFWAVTKWEREADDASSSRWIVLIAFLIGLSIGVHLLNLLVIPTVGLIIYFKRFRYSLKGLLVAIFISGAGVLLVLQVIIPGLLSLSEQLELLFVNQLSLPVHSGLITWLILLAASMAAGLGYTYQRQFHTANLALLCLTFLLIGYTSYTATLIRASADVPVNQGNPDSTFSLLNYLKREQYGTRPILYGANFNSVATGYRDRTTWILKDNRYVKSKLNGEMIYADNTIGFFPRMHSNDPELVDVYKTRYGFKGRKTTVTDRDGTEKTIQIPTFRDNWSFFLNYQLGYMYLRYFMWNFAGRQNDIQGTGGMLNGNWASGIPFVDEQVNGPQKNLPTEMAENKGRNSYFFLPLLLGLAGLAFQYRNDRKNFLATGLLFFMMSVALVVYLNEVPVTPRERDYVYVGSFYVFCIWIGFGILWLWSLLQGFLKTKPAAMVSLAIGMLASPVLLLAQNYDDHNRAGRYTARDLARNYLESCQPNAILFTHADNDTYPLWYCQEVEGIRKDVRVVVMPYLQAEWYIRQLAHKIYQNDGLEMTISPEKYQSGTLDYLYVVPKIETEQSMSDLLEFLASDSSATKLELESGEKIGYIPANKLRLNLPGPDTIRIELTQRALTRGDVVFWDIINSNRGKRPICFTSWIDPDEHRLKNHLILDGMVYRLTPESTEGESILNLGKIDSEAMYNTITKKCNWDNLNTPVYFDWHHRRMFASMQLRTVFYRLANQLTIEKQTVRALEVLHLAGKSVPLKNWTVDYQSILMAGLYAKNGAKDEGQKQIEEIQQSLEEWLNYFRQFRGDQKRAIADDAAYKLALYQELIHQSEDTLSAEERTKMKDRFLEFAAAMD